MAQAALDAGDPATAAGLFRDPRRKAYAELKAGRYAQAAQGFAAFDDAAAQYDRGNALARAGDLQQALQAYDAALAKDPNDRDARHNRDLVAKALAQQPPPTKPSGKPGSSGDSGQSGGSGKAELGQGRQGRRVGARGVAWQRRVGTFVGPRGGVVAVVGRVALPVPSGATRHPRRPPARRRSLRPVPRRRPAAPFTTRPRRRSARPPALPPVPRGRAPRTTRSAPHRRRPGATRRPPSSSWPRTNGCAAFPTIRPGCCGASS